MKLLYTFAIILLFGLAFAQPVVAQTYPANPKPATSTQDTVAESGQQKKKSKEQPKKKTRVVMKREVTRTSMMRRSDVSPNKLEIIIKQAGSNINNPEDLQMTGSNGSVVTLGNYMGFENLELPFEGIIRFKAPNLMNTAIYTREVKFVVADPGQWVLRIDL